MKLFDSHAHIGAPELLAEAPGMIERAKAAGVTGMLAIGAGYGIGNNAGAVMLAQENAGVWASVGVHPHDASEWSPLRRDRARRLAAHERVVAVGECGLDYFTGTRSRRPARRARGADRDRAGGAEPPLVIHVRPSRDSRDGIPELAEISDATGADRVAA